MAYNFPYLKDSAFLKRFDEMRNKEQFIKIVILNFKEEPIEEIQGKVVGGNISLDGTSTMRRTGNINLIADDYENDLTTTKNLLSINKKIEVLVGFTNTTEEYENYDILWFPQGTYVIINPNISHSASGISISLTLHDKMAMLNGECGGVLPASVVFDQIIDVDENGAKVITRPTIFQIIQELVNHFGGEQLSKILISDVDSKIKKVMKWTGSTPLYLYQGTSSQGTINHFDTNYQNVEDNYLNVYGNGTITPFYYGDDVGYILTDFVYPTDLIGNAGDTVVTILDQIRDILGNYEYFYDINGNFRFQQIKNYLNTSYATVELNNMNLDDYLVDYTTGKSVYTFEDANLITSYSNSPQYQQIKNDFVVWGKRTNVYGKDIPIRYHLAIDKKPQVGNEYEVFFYIDPNDEIMKAKKPNFSGLRTNFPVAGEEGFYYYAADEDKIYKWISFAGGGGDYEATAYRLEIITTNDFRTQLYMAGVASQPYGLDSNYYYTELKNEWPKLYDMRGEQPTDDEISSSPRFKRQVLKQPSDIDFFLDFIDTPTALAEFSVENIGRRTTTIVDDSINCVFEPNNPDLIIIQSGSNSVEMDAIQDDCRAKGREFILVKSEIYSMLLPGGSLRSAYEEIRKELYQYTNYNEQISVNALPIYYLEPNTRITVRDPESGINGDYMIKNISLPLDINGTMSLSCTRAFERI